MLDSPRGGAPLAPIVAVEGTRGQPRPKAGAGRLPVDPLAQEFPKVGIHDVSFVVAFARRGCGSCQGAVSSRSRDSPRDPADFTAPSEQPSTSAVSAWVSCSQ